MKFKNKEELLSYYNRLWESREGDVAEWMKITATECRMYQRERKEFVNFMFDRHLLFDDYNKYVTEKKNECRNLKTGDRIRYVSERASECFTKSKEYVVSRKDKGLGTKDIWFTSDIGKYGYIVEDDYIYEFELVKNNK